MTIESSTAIRLKECNGSLARNIRENEAYLTLNMGTPVSYNSSILAEFGITAGTNRYIYFPADNYSQYDVEDRTSLAYLTGRLKMAQTTLDEQVLARELAPLRQIRDNYPKYLLTMDEAFGEMNYEGIQKRNVLKWMLE